MSWDVVIIRVKGERPGRVEEVAETVCLGTASEVRGAISRYVPEVEWREGGGWGVLDAGIFSIEFALREQDPVESFVLHVRGQGHPEKAIMAFVVPNGWSAIDCSTGKFLEAEGTSTEGWDGYRALLARGWVGG